VLLIFASEVKPGYHLHALNMTLARLSYDIWLSHSNFSSHQPPQPLVINLIQTSMVHLKNLLVFDQTKNIEYSTLFMTLLQTM
jgi:hypothetical protein